MQGSAARRSDPVPSKHKTSVVLRPQDAKILAALGMSPTDAIREFCAGRGEDGMLVEPAPATVQPIAGIVLLDDPDARDPHSDGKPDKPPPTPHGWTFTGTLQRQPDGTDRWVGQHIARPSSLDELSRLVSVAPGRVRFAAPHVLIVSEVSDAG